MQSMLSETNVAIAPNDELYHHGIKGMSWGNRRWQYGDGSLTPEGRIHYGVGEARDKLSAMSKDFISKYNNVKIDTLDVLNRKGVLDFLDSKADASFSSIKSGIGSGRFQDTSAGKDVFRAMSNLERYNEISNKARKIKQDKESEGVDTEYIDYKFGPHSPALKQREQKLADSNRYSKMLDMYSKENMSGFINGLVKAEGQTTYDKMLGMQSKTARDMDREAKTNEFINQIKKDGYWDVSKISERWKKTDFDGYLVPYEKATGLSGNIYKDVEEKIPKYKPIPGEPDEVRTNTIEWKTYAGNTQPGHYDLDNNLHKYDKNGIARETYTTVWKSLDNPGNAYFDENDTYTQTSRKVVGKTQEYLDYMKDADAAMDYSKLIKDYQSTIDYGDDWLKTLKHIDNFSDELYHHGTKGQKWGKRRYQYENGSLTDEGRVHYGVGPAREKLGKAAAAVKDAVRKTVNPTSQDLDEKIAKANAKNAAKLEKMQKRDELRAARNAVKDKKLNDKLEEARLKEERQIKKEYIDKVNGKKKDIDKMSDRELQDELIRLQKERQIRDMDKDLNQGAVGKFMEQYVRTAVGEGLRRGVSEGIGTRLGRVVGGDAEKYKLQKAENKLKLDILKGDEVISKNAQKKLYELDNRGKDDFTKQKTSEILSEAQDKLKLAVLLGDDQTSADAAGRLRNYDNSTKNKSYSDKLRDEQDRLKYDVLTGDKQTRKAAADKLRDFDKATEKPKKASIGDKVRDEQDKLKLDVLTGDKKIAKDASKRLQKLTEATSKNNNQKKQQQQQQKKKQQQGQNGKS